MSQGYLWVPLLFLMASSASAESDAIVNQRVRLRLVANHETVIGRALAATHERLTLGKLDSDPPREIPWRDVQKLEMSRGKKRNTLKGLLAGAALWGAIVGAVAAVDTLDESGVGEPVFVGALLLGGGIVGYRHQTETWERVPIPSTSDETR
jgi:hypothetical protein